MVDITIYIYTQEYRQSNSVYVCLSLSHLILDSRPRTPETEKRWMGLRKLIPLTGCPVCNWFKPPLMIPSGDLT